MALAQSDRCALGSYHTGGLSMRKSAREREGRGGEGGEGGEGGGARWESGGNAQQGKAQEELSRACPLHGQAAAASAGRASGLGGVHLLAGAHGPAVLSNLDVGHAEGIAQLVCCFHQRGGVPAGRQVGRQGRQAGGIQLGGVGWRVTSSLMEQGGLAPAGDRHIQAPTSAAGTGLGPGGAHLTTRAVSVQPSPGGLTNSMKWLSAQRK